MAVSKARIAKWREGWAKNGEMGVDPLQEGVDRLMAWKADPLKHSALPYWLQLEYWDFKEGMRVLAGVDPDSVEYEASLDGYPISDGELVNAQPFFEHFSFSVVPEPHDMTQDSFKNVDDYEAYLERTEHRLEVLRPIKLTIDALWHKLDHSPSARALIKDQKHHPSAYIAWAVSVAFRPQWYDWAERCKLLPCLNETTAAPYFDADSDSYPQLLHIAVRAWEAAKGQAAGTPKQRIERFLADRYPQLPASTRSAIALVANWRKAGGRPKQSK